MKRPKIITIDGPAGAGKSTLAKEIAKRFGYIHLDSGAIYRAIGWKAWKLGVNLKDEEEVLKVADKMEIELIGDRVIVDGRDVTNEIRTPLGGTLASEVAQHKGVRDLVIKILRKISKGKRVVIDGRDAGTYIFPEAELKIFLTASPEERAKRRFQELKSKGFKITYEEVFKEVVERDKRDKNRQFAPLKIPEGAVVIDTTGKSLSEVINEINRLIDP